MHRLLSRQLKKLKITESVIPNIDLWQAFIEQVDNAYNASDQDRYTLERSLTISSEEMQALYLCQKKSYENRMYSILNAMPDVLFLLTEDSKCIEVMSGNKEYIDKNRALTVGKYAHDVFSKDKADFFCAVIMQALDSGQLVVVNYELELNGVTRQFEGRVMPSQYEVEGKRTVVFIAIDITRRVGIELQQKLIATVFNSSKEGMLILDKKLRLVTVNEAFCQINGETTKTIADAIPGLIHNLLNKEIGKAIKKAIRNNGYWIGEVAGYYQDGKSYPLLLTINTVQDSSGDIINYVVMLSDVSEIKRSQEELEHVATHDALTHLPNRVLFQDRLEQAIKRVKRNNSIGALFFLDLDRFKNVNDNLGHQVGDELLIQASERLKSACRSSDTLARLGGDEFTIIIDGLNNTDQLASIAEKILAAFTLPFDLGGYKLDISVSIGISVFPNDSADSVELIKYADTAMYCAKESGRNTYQFYTQELASNAFEYFAIEIELRKALACDQFYLVYQPQYNIKTGEIIGVETLLRWQHPEMGIISPATFIPIAEKSGQIAEIGEWVIAQACRQIQIWDDLGLPQLVVSINLSRRQLVISDLASSVQKILDDYAIDGSRLEFEITESAIVDNYEMVYSNLLKFKKMGIAMAIDDFGTGYSSLVNLKQFPLSRLKIDQSFVRDVIVDSNDEAIIRATIALGTSLGLTIIAEGVETKEQCNFLLREGCEQAQGFLFSKPLLAEDVTDLLTYRQPVENIRCSSSGND